MKKNTGQQKKNKDRLRFKIANTKPSSYQIENKSRERRQCSLDDLIK